MDSRNGGGCLARGRAKGTRPTRRCRAGRKGQQAGLGGGRTQGHCRAAADAAGHLCQPGNSRRGGHPAAGAVCPLHIQLHPLGGGLGACTERREAISLEVLARGRWQRRCCKSACAPARQNPGGGPPWLAERKPGAAPHRRPCSRSTRMLRHLPRSGCSGTHLAPLRPGTVPPAPSPPAPPAAPCRCPSPTPRGSPRPQAPPPPLPRVHQLRARGLGPCPRRPRNPAPLPAALFLVVQLQLLLAPARGGHRGHVLA